MLVSTPGIDPVDALNRVLVPYIVTFLTQIGFRIAPVSIELGWLTFLSLLVVALGDYDASRKFQYSKNNIAGRYRG